MSDPPTDSTPSPDPDASTCSSCGVELEPDSAPRGLCPRCLMAEAMAETETPEGDQDRSAKPEPPAIEAVQAAFPQLKILELIGVGGMGVVYKARQKSLRRHVALKLLSPHRGDEPGFAERFAREAQALAALNHPNIVTVHDFGEAAGFFYLLMEYVDGVNLRQAISTERFTPEQALAIVPPICEALQFAHDRGIVHRDIKPENLLLDKDGRIKVADFGIARILDQDPSEAESSDTSSALETEISTDSDADPGLTGDTKLGTPRYMAPEQSEHPEQVDHRADIYSLGVVFYEMLTGEAPSGRFVPPSSRVAVDVRLDEVVLRALADSPELRWQTAADLRTQVETIVADPSSTAAASPVSLANVGPPPLPPADSSAATVTAPREPSAAATAAAPTAPSPAAGATVGKGCLIAGGIGGGVCVLLLVLLSFFGVFTALVTYDPSASAAISEAQADLNVADAERRRARNQLSQHAQQFPDYQQLDENSRAARQGRELEQQLTEATQQESVIRSRLDHLQEDQSPRVRGRLSWIALLLIGTLEVVGGALVLWWIFSKKRSAGCIVLALLAIAAPFLLTFLYFVAGSSMVRSSPSVIVNSTVGGPTPSATSRYILRRALVQTGPPRGTNKDPSYEFVCKFDALEIANGWELWLTQNQSHVVDGKLRSGGSGSLNIRASGQGKMILDDLEWNEQLQEDIQSKLQSQMGAVITIQSGTPVSILNVTDSKGEQLDISVELRPAPDFSGHPATQLFVREVDSQPTKGHLALAFNEILTVSGFDLVLETHGAAARFDSRGKIDDATPPPISYSEKVRFSRVFIRQGGSLRFDFPAIADFDITSLLPSSGTSVKISPDRPWKIFDITDLESGHRAWAELRLEPEGAVVEMLPEKIEAEELPAPDSKPEAEAAAPARPQDALLRNIGPSPVGPEKGPNPLAPARTALTRFLEADRWTQRLPMIYDSEALQEKIADYYRHPSEPELGPHDIEFFHMEEGEGPGKPYYIFFVTTPDIPQGFPVIIRKVGERYLIDWECFVEFHDHHFVSFRTIRKPSQETFASS